MKVLPGISRADWLCAAALWATALVVFGAGAARLGFYYDDSTWMTDLPSATPSTLLHTMRGYIPGRNLFPFWQYLIYKAVPDPASHLAELHLIQSALDGFVVVVFFFLLRLLSLSGDVTVMAAGLFSFWPMHGETHYWPTAIPQNLLSTIFVLIFAGTSLILVRGGRGRLVWLLDAAAFCAALFTYDQPAVVLVAMAGCRVAYALLERPKGFAFAAAHLPYLAPIVLYALLKWKTVPGAGPTFTIEALRLARLNLPVTVSDTAGRLWLRKMTLLYEKATPDDWLLAMLVAAVLTGLALVRCGEASKPEAPSPDLRRLLVIAAVFYIAAYVPVWIWQVSPRHHLLPSAGLFTAAAICLTLITAKASRRAARLLLLLTTGGVALAFAAASRGESRYWEESFAIKRQLFEEIKPDLAGKQALTLDDFPASLGPAYLISPHDAGLAPRLLYGRAFPLASGFTGSIGSVPAPNGVFLHTLLSIYGANQFLFVPDAAALQVQFAGWEHGRLRFEKNQARRLLYESLASAQSSASEPRTAPARSPASVALSGGHSGDTNLVLLGASARQESRDAVVSFQLDATLPRGNCLAATVSFMRGEGFHRWGAIRDDVGFNAFPVLLGPLPAESADVLPCGAASPTGQGTAANAPPGAGHRWAQTLRLHDFPETEQIQVEFFAASASHLPISLGRAQAALER